MRQKEVYTLDSDEGKAVELFVKLGVPRNMAKTLLCVSQVEECRSADVEQSADLRQPEVSVAIQDLLRRGWIVKRDRKNQGKGRPVHIYRTVMDLSEIFTAFEQEKLKEIENLKKDLSELKNMTLK